MPTLGWATVRAVAIMQGASLLTFIERSLVMCEYFNTIAEIVPSKSKTYPDVSKSMNYLRSAVDNYEWVTSAIPCDDVQDRDCTEKEKQMRKCLQYIETAHNSLVLPRFISFACAREVILQLYGYAERLVAIASPDYVEGAGRLSIIPARDSLSDLDYSMSRESGWLARNYINYCNLRKCLGELCADKNILDSMAHKLDYSEGEELVGNICQQLGGDTSRNISWRYVFRSLFEAYDMLQSTREQLLIQKY